MTGIWAKPVGAHDEGYDYWEYWGARMVSHAAIVPGIKVLDVGTGDAGSSLFPAAKKTGSNGQVVGIDICPHCVREAVLEIKKRGVHNAFISEMNAENLGFEKDSFDLILGGFMGWDYCYDFQKGTFTAPDTRMTEIWRVLREGGRIILCTWEQQEDIEWLTDEFSKHLPDYVTAHANTKKHLPLVYSKETPEGYKKIFSKAGFKDIEIIQEKVAFVNPDEEAWWEMMRNVGWWRHFEQLEEIGDKTLLMFQEKVFNDLQSHKHDDGIHFTKSVAFAIGRK